MDTTFTITVNLTTLTQWIVIAMLCGWIVRVTKRRKQDSCSSIVRHVLSDMTTHCFTMSVAVNYFLSMYYPVRHIHFKLSPRTILRMFGQNKMNTAYALSIHIKYVKPHDTSATYYYGHALTMIKDKHQTTWHVLQSDYQLYTLRHTHSISHRDCLLLLDVLSKRVWFNQHITTLQTLLQYTFQSSGTHPHHVLCNIQEFR
jgi:hypothetical protein